MLKLLDVWKDYKIDKDVVFTALKGIDFEVKKGEFVAITGPSGSGKSTMMQIVGLLDKPTKGEVLIEGRDATKLNDNELSQLRSEFVGFVFQQFNLINKLTTLENIILPTIYSRKKLSYNPEEKAKYLAERFGLTDKLKSYPNRMSGGQQQRIAIARALIMDPALVLADEPTGNLDTKTGEEIMKLLLELNEQDGRTIVLVTHESNIAAKAKRIARIVDGKIEV